MTAGLAAQGLSFVAQIGASYLLARISAQDGPRLQNLNAASGEYGVAIPRAYGSAARYTLPLLAMSDIKETEHEVQDYSEVVGAISGAAQGFLVAGPVGAVVGAVLGGLFGAAAPDQKYYTYSYPAIGLLIADRLDDEPIEDLLKAWANGRLLFDPAELAVESETFDSDGNLLKRVYGKNRYFESLTIYGGGGEQTPDAILEEHIGPQPGYRFRAYAVIEELQLEYFGNAFPAPIEGLVQAKDGQTVAEFASAVGAAAGIEATREYSSSELASLPLAGYAVTEQRNCWDAIKPILPAYRCDAADVAGQVRFYKRKQNWRASITANDLGSYQFGNSPPERITFSRLDPTQTPEATTLTFIDPERDYQANTAISQRSGGDSRSNIDVTLALTLSADEGATAASTMHWDASLGNVTSSFALTDDWLGIEPGRVYALPVEDTPLPYRIVRKNRGANGLIEIDARSDESVVYSGVVRGSAGDAVTPSSTMFAETVVVPIDMPMTSDAHDDFGFYLAMGASADYWRRGRIEVSSDGVNFAVAVDSNQSAVMGDVTGTLAAGTTDGFDDTLDTTTVLTVELLHDGMTLSNATDAELDANLNYGFVGVDGRGEYLQWKTATKIAPRTWELTNLRRGRRGTEYAIGTHGAGEQFVELGKGGIFRIVAVDDSGWSDVLTLRGVHLFEDSGGQTETSFANTGQAKRPYAPSDVAGTFDGSGDLDLTWTRRSRFDTGELETDAPEAYEVDIYVGATFKRTLSSSTPDVIYTAAQQSTDGFSNGDTITAQVFQVNTDYGRSAANSYDIVVNATEIDYGVMQFLAGDGTAGTSDYTTSELDGTTPQVAMIFANNHRATFDPAGSQHAALSVGAVDNAGNQFALASRTEDGQSSTDVSRRGYDDRALVRISTLNGAVSNFATGALINEGLQLDWDSGTTPTDYKAFFMGFAGPGVSAKAGVIDLGTGTSPIDVDGLGFEADVVFFYSINDPIDGASDDFFGWTFGVALNDGTMRCVSWSEGDGEAASNPFQTLFNDCAIAQIATDGTGSTYKCTVGGFDSDKFQVTPNASAFNDRIGYVAIRLADKDVAILDIDTPTATGTQAYTGAGFPPRAGMAVQTFLEALNDEAATSTIQQSGYGISTFTATSSEAMSARINAGDDPSDTASNQRPHALMTGGGSNTRAVYADLTSLDADGVTLDYLGVDAAAKKGFLILFE